MRRATRVIAAERWDGADAIDSITLDADERHRRRLVLTGDQGTVFLLDLPQAVALRHGDGLVLDDGAMVRVAGRPEPLFEITTDRAEALARLAWHLGNRHVEIQILGERLRIRRDPVLETMLRSLSARIAPIEAVFEPEGGAYREQHDHGHGTQATKTSLSS